MRTRVNITLTREEHQLLSALRSKSGLRTLSAVVKHAALLCARLSTLPEPSDPFSDLRDMFATFADAESPRLGDLSQLTKKRKQ